MNNTKKISRSRFYILFLIAILSFNFHVMFEDVSLIAKSVIVLMLGLHIILILFKENWWSSTKYVLVYVLIIIMALILRYGFDLQVSALLWPSVIILGTLKSKYDKIAITLVSFVIIAILFMSYINDFHIETLLALIGTFLGVRSIRIRREAYKASQLHLEELNKAHKELEEAHSELLEASVHSMKYAALEERTRLAQEIHDGLGHQLTSLIVQLQALQIMLSDEPKKAPELVSQLLQISRSAMAEVRIAVKEWSDDEMGLGHIALKGLVSQVQARSSIKFNFFQDSEISEWSTETGIVLYRILQESMTNILRHSNAKSVEIHIHEVEGNIILSVSDDGDYLGDTPLTPGFGMKGIMDRCKSLGGTCSINSKKPHGLHIKVTLPNT